MKHFSKSGAALAAAAFGLVTAGVALAPATSIAADNVQCSGVNACKGQAACKSASNSCKGQNACKGQGWISTSAEQCKAWGGKIQS
jgi:hypothetical protein